MAINKSKIGEAFVSLSVDNNPLHRGLKMARKTLGDFGSGMSRVGGGMMGVGGAMMGTAAGLAAPLVGAMSAGMKFQSVMSEVRAITGATGDGFESLEAKAKELGASTTFSASQVAEAMKFLGMAGFSDAQILASIDSVLSLARAGNVELGMAADIASDVGSAFGLSADEFGRVADVIAKTATSANTNIEMMGETFRTAAPIAKAAGQSLEEVSAAAGLLGNSGIKASVAGTDLKNIMSKIADPTAQAKIEQYAGAVLDANGQMLPMLDILRNMQAGMSNMTGAQKLAAMMDIFGERSAKSAIVLSDAGNQIDSMREKMNNAAGAAAAMAGIMADNTTGSFAALTSAIEGVSIEIHDALAPAFNFMMGMLTSIAQRVRGFIVENQQLVLQIVAAITAFGAFGAGLLSAGMALTLVGVSISAIATAISVLMSPLGLAAGAIVMIGAAFLASSVDTATAIESIRVKAQGIVHFIKPIAEGIMNAINADRFALAGEIAMAALRVAIMKGLSSIAEMVGNAMSGIWSAITGALSGDMSGVKNLFKWAEGQAFAMIVADDRLASLLEEAKSLAAESEAATEDVEAAASGNGAEAATPAGEAITNAIEQQATTAAQTAVNPSPESVVATAGFDFRDFQQQLAGIQAPDFKTLGGFDAQFAGSGSDPSLGLLQQISDTNQRMLELEETREPLTFGSGA